MIRDREVLALELHQASLERGWLLVDELRGDRPILLLLKGLNLAFALHDQAQRYRLNTPGRNASADFVPKQWTYLVAHQTVQDAASLLRLNEVFVDFSRMLERGPHGVACDFVKDDAVELLLLGFQQSVQMRADGLSFAVGVGGQIDRFGAGRGALQFLDDLLLGGDNAVAWRKVLLDSNA